MASSDRRFFLKYRLGVNTSAAEPMPYIFLGLKESFTRRLLEIEALPGLLLHVTSDVRIVSLLRRKAENQQGCPEKSTRI
jgi:hypothetical protein